MVSDWDLAEETIMEASERFDDPRTSASARKTSPADLNRVRSHIEHLIATKRQVARKHFRRL